MLSIIGSEILKALELYELDKEMEQRAQKASNQTHAYTQIRCI